MQNSKPIQVDSPPLAGRAWSWPPIDQGHRARIRRAQEQATQAEHARRGGLEREQRWCGEEGERERERTAARIAAASRDAAFGGTCHCGAPGLYAMHAGLTPAGRVVWFCEEHRP